MAATTTLLGLVTPTQGTLSGTWGDTVNYGISDYVDISVAGTLTLTNDGAVTLANTTGSSSGNSITSSLTGAGTVTAQFAIVKVTGTLTVAKVVTGPSYSKTYTVVNSATGGIVTFKASGQTGVSVAVGESAFVYYNGTDYVKVSGTVAVASFQTSLGGLTPSTATTGVVTLAGTLNTTSGGTGLTSFTAGDVPYYASGTLLSKLAIGTAGQFLTSTGTAPQWSTLSGVAVTTFSAGTTGFTPSSATSGAVTLAGTLATTNGGTGLTSFTSGGVVYASSSSALATGSALTFNGTTLGITTTSGTRYLTLNAPTDGGYIAFETGGTPFADFGSFKAIVGSGSATDLYIGTRSTNNLIFATSSTEAMRLTSSSLYTASGINVGFGTSSPFASPKLTVFNSATISTGGDGGGNGVFIAATTGSASGGQLVVAGSDTAAIDKGGAIVFAGKWDTATNDIAQWAKIAGYKENATNNNYSGYLGFYTRANGGAATERARIDSSGNMGLGVTPSAWGSNYKALQIFSSAPLALVASGDDSSIATNAYVNNAGTWFFVSTSSYKPTKYAQYLGQHQWHTATASGSANATISFTQAMTLDASGNLGLGTTSPAVRLDVNGGGTSLGGTTEINTQITQDTTNKRGLLFGYDTTSQIGIIGANSAGNASSLAFWTYNSGWSEKARIDSSGNVGIGTSSPSVKLDITGYETRLLAPGSGKSISIYADAGGSVIGYLSSGYLLFGKTTSTISTQFTEQMRLDSSGNLGIGTSSPSTTLTIKTANNVGTQIFKTADTTNSMLSIYDSQAAGNASYTLIGTDTTGAVTGFSSGGNFLSISKNGTGTVRDLILHNYDAANIRFATNNAERARIDSSGCFGVGTSSPASYGGSAFTKSVNIGSLNTITAGFSDGVSGTFRIAHASGQNILNFDTSALCFQSGGSTPTERVRIDSSGNLLVGATAVGNGGKLYVNGSISLGTSTTGAQSSMAKDTTQLTTSISTTATTIYTDISSGMSSASAGYFIIYGNNNSGAGFMDVVVAKANGTPVVVSSSTIEGSPPARTYSVSSFALRLAMASGTFNVNLKATVLGYPF